MQTMILALIFAGFLCSSTYGQDCSLCDLTGYFNSTNGYNCYAYGASVLCTCPGGSAYEINRPCRLCNRPDPSKNACDTNSSTNPNLYQCIEERLCGTPYACLCKDSSAAGASFTLNANCDTTNTLTCSTTTGPAPGPSPCLNGGVSVDTKCHCPSGYSGLICQDKYDSLLCTNITCKNRGVCAVQNPNGPYQPVCLCRYGTSGKYCELSGTQGFCSSGLCMNGGACQENVVGSTRFAYCQCQPGYNGTKCENQYFTCPRAGKFRDADMHDQSRYFECITVNGALRPEQRSCPNGLRFNETKQLCTQ